MLVGVKPHWKLLEGGEGGGTVLEGAPGRYQYKQQSLATVKGHGHPDAVYCLYTEVVLSCGSVKWGSNKQISEGVMAA